MLHLNFSLLGVVTVGQYIYAVGGYDSCSQLRTVERYDPERNVWEYRASMLHPRSALSAAVLDNEIWVFGKWNSFCLVHGKLLLGSL